MAVSTQIQKIWIWFFTGLVLVLSLHWCPQKKYLKHITAGSLKAEETGRNTREHGAHEIEEFWWGDTGSPAVISLVHVQKWSDSGSMWCLTHCFWTHLETPIQHKLDSKEVSLPDGVKTMFQHCFKKDCLILKWPSVLKACANQLC